MSRTLRWASTGGLIVLVTSIAAQVLVPRSVNGELFGRLWRGRTGCVPARFARLELLSSPRIADPKLTRAAIQISFHLPSPAPPTCAIVEIMKGGQLVREVWRGVLQPGSGVTEAVWNGRDSSGQYVDTGDYTIRVRGERTVQCDQAPLSIVRLGITEIETRSAANQNDEWQMVYFRKGSAYEFFATPAIHEYLCTADSGETSDLDLNNGDPRPVPPVHLATDSPVLEGGNYEDDTYNYPLCLRAGAQPLMEFTFGTIGTAASGQVMAAGYPVQGFEIRFQARWSDGTLSRSGPLSPGAKASLPGPTLPPAVTRVDESLECSWQYRSSSSSVWNEIPGSTTIPLRFYTVIGTPVFAPGAQGLQYSGPWVEVAEYWHQWRTQLGIAMTSEEDCLETHVKGFFGQNGGIATPIEGLIYDAGPLGGNSGASHYHSSSTWKMNLSALLHGGDVSRFFNCSDNMGATSTMLAMMGVQNVQPVKLGRMHLRAIWGIGAPSYTINLWGRSHQFSYHHVVTRDGALHIIDSCMQLDEDGDPDTVPGTPGWNQDRAWNGMDGYANLSASNPLTKTLQTLPGLR